MRLASRRLALSAGLLSLTSCAGPTWEQVRSQDTPAGYRQFIADHPRSAHAAEAKERLAVLQFEREPSLEALERFRRDHPESAAIPDMRARLETRMFDAARAAATPAAYERFLAEFPDGAQSERARGNLAFLAAGGFSGRVDALAAFAERHPASDYAAEVRRSLQGVEARRAGTFVPVGLRIEIAPGVPDASRLHNLFAQRAHEIYADAGLRIVEGGSTGATLVIRHDERRVDARGSDDLLARPGVLAETDVSLASADGGQVFEHRFQWRVPDTDVRPGGSALLAKSSSAFWEHFFVPVATWPTSAAKRAEWRAGGALAGVGGDLGRAVAVAPDGSFREIDLADPTQPRVVGQYLRAGGLARYSGARTISGRVVMYGEDGLEVVARQGGGYRRVAGFDRGVVGGVVGLEHVDGRILVAGTRGLLRVPLDGGPVERLVERPLRGIARDGDTLYLLDDKWLYAAPVRDPRATSFFTAAELARGQEPRGLRASGGLALVVGEGGASCFALSPGGTARPLARLRISSVGHVADGAIVGGKVFLLGERGLLVVEPDSGRIVDSVDVAGTTAVGIAGGQIVTVGGDQLDVVDASPWTARGSAASLAP
jgi:hypothetical protein